MPVGFIAKKSGDQHNRCRGQGGASFRHRGSFGGFASTTVGDGLPVLSQSSERPPSTAPAQRELQTRPKPQTKQKNRPASGQDFARRTFARAAEIEASTLRGGKLEVRVDNLAQETRCERFLLFHGTWTCSLVPCNFVQYNVFKSLQFGETAEEEARPHRVARPAPTVFSPAA